MSFSFIKRWWNREYLHWTNHDWNCVTLTGLLIHSCVFHVIKKVQVFFIHWYIFNSLLILCNVHNCYFHEKYYVLFVLGALVFRHTHGVDFLRVWQLYFYANINILSMILYTGQHMTLYQVNTRREMSFLIILIGVWA